MSKPMTLSNRERKLLEAVLTGLRDSTRGATSKSLIAKGLVCGPAWDMKPTALGRFVGEPLEWQRGEHRITADFPGGFAIVHTLPDDRGSFNWGACIRGRWSQEPMAATCRAAREACEVWVNEERLRVAGGES